MSLSQVGQIFPEMLDLVDSDSYGRRMADYMGVPADGMRDQEEVDAVREQRAQQQQQQMAAQQAESTAKALKDGGQGAKSLAESGIDGQAMEQAMGGMGG